MATHITCPRCGQLRSITENFCGNCEYPLRNVQGPKSKKRLVIGFMAVVIVLIIVFISGIQVGKNIIGVGNTIQGTPNHLGTAPVNGTVVGITPSPTPTPTLTPTPTASPTPVVPGTVICDTTKPGQGWSNWNLVTGWKVLNGELLYDGTGNGERLVAPDFCQPTVANYAVDIRMRIVAACCHFGFIMRGNAVSTGYDGYQLFIYTTTFQNVNISSLGGQGGGSVGYTFDNNFHVYRGEVKDNLITFLIDGAKILSVNDNTFLMPGEVSICCTDTMELEITYFKVTAL